MIDPKDLAALPDVIDDFTPWSAKFKASYQIAPEVLGEAKANIEMWTIITDILIEGTREFSKGKGPINEETHEPQYQSLEAFYQTMMDDFVVKAHLGSAIMSKQALMGTSIELSKSTDKPYMRELFTLGMLRPFLAYTYENLLVPLMQQESSDETLRRFNARMNDWMLPFAPSADAEWSPVSIILNFLRYAKFAITSVLVLGVKSGLLQDMIANSTATIGRMDKGFRDTWVTTNFKNILPTNQLVMMAQLMDAMSRGKQAVLSSVTYTRPEVDISLKGYPNQGLAVALLAYFWVVQQRKSISMTGDVIHTYDADTMPKVPDTQEHIMATTSMTAIFEHLF